MSLLAADWLAMRSQWSDGERGNLTAQPCSFPELLQTSNAVVRMDLVIGMSLSHCYNVPRQRAFPSLKMKSESADHGTVDHGLHQNYILGVEA